MLYLKENKPKLLYYLAFYYMLFLNHFYYLKKALSCTHMLFYIKGVTTSLHILRSAEEKGMLTFGHHKCISQSANQIKHIIQRSFSLAVETSCHFAKRWSPFKVIWVSSFETETLWEGYCLISAISTNLGSFLFFLSERFVDFFF